MMDELKFWDCLEPGNFALFPLLDGISVLILRNIDCFEAWKESSFLG